MSIRKKTLRVEATVKKRESRSIIIPEITDSLRVDLENK